MKKNVLSFSIFALMILMLASCASSKKVAYFQNAVDGVVKRSEGLYDAKIMPKDISEIIQVVDLDGAYIPHDCILFDPDLTEEESPLYTDTSINCVDVEKIVRRNKQKRENLNDLSSRKTIKVKAQTKPYSVYYFSSNLDLFLHHNANLDYRQKVALADSFSSEFIGDVDGFIRTISEDPGAVNGMTYDESWSFIKDGKNSLGRHTNLNILLNKLLSEE